MQIPEKMQAEMQRGSIVTSRTSDGWRAFYTVNPDKVALHKNRETAIRLLKKMYEVKEEMPKANDNTVLPTSE